MAAMRIKFFVSLIERGWAGGLSSLQSRAAPPMAREAEPNPDRLESETAISMRPIVRHSSAKASR